MQNNPDFLLQRRAKKVKLPRHLMFSSNSDEDSITICLCGVLKGVPTRNLKEVTCPKCATVAAGLMSLDNYAQALVYIDDIAPKVIVPDPEIMNERYGDRPTKAAARHMDALNYLKSRHMKHPSEIPGNMIGSTKETYFFNLTELDLVNEQGESVSETADLLQSIIDGPTSGDSDQ